MTWVPTLVIQPECTEMDRFRDHMAEFGQWITSNEQDKFETALNLINHSIKCKFFFVLDLNQ